MLNFFLSRSKRNAYITLLALDAELYGCTVKSVDPTITQIRLKWWADEIDKIFHGLTVNTSPILTDLMTVINNFKLCKDSFDKLIDTYAPHTEIHANEHEAFYNLALHLLDEQKDQRKFERKITLNRNLPVHTPMRAFRLWLGR